MPGNVVFRTSPVGSLQVVTVADVQQAVAEFFQIPLDSMVTWRRTSEVAFPRQIAMYLARELTMLSLVNIGGRFGGRDHTTVMYAHAKISRRIKEDDVSRQIVLHITETLTAPASVVEA